MKPISAVILAKNEEKNIEACMAALDFCDEIIVIDDYSTDNTVKLVGSKATIFQRRLDGDFAGQRNFGMEKAKHEWVLFVDTDERISAELKKEIVEVAADSSTQCYSIRRRDWFWGKELKHGEVQKVCTQGLIRLVKKGSGTWKDKVHEEFITDKSVAHMAAFLEHYPHQTLKEFIHDINVYSSLRAHELASQDQTANIGSVIAYPFFKFLLVYFIYLGFLDGAPGFVYAFLMSFHSFLVRVKLYQLKTS